MAFESQVLDEVTAARARYVREAPIHEQAVVSEATSDAVRSLFAVVEGYPELRAHENVMALQAEIGRLETLIARRRELFNEQAYQHNATIGQVPAVLLRSFFGWRTVEMFSAEAHERSTADVRVDLIS
jgi:LemA protein